MSGSDPAMSTEETVEQTFGNVVHDPRYSFCTDPHRPLRGDFDLCRFATNNPVDCPAFAKACKEAVPDPGARDSFAFAGGSALASLVFWVLVLAIVAWCANRIAKNFRGGQTAAPSPAGGTAQTRVGSEAIGKRKEFAEKDPAKLLAGAREALGQGDESLAARLGHAALVRALEREGHLTVDKSLTNGDYARTLRAVPELREVFRATAVEVEKSEFGAEKPSPERLGRLLARIKPVVERAAAIGSILLALLGTSCSVAGDGDPEDAPGGDSMLRELFVRRGAEYARRTHPLSELGDEKTDLVIVDSSAHLEKEDWVFIETWVEDGGTLVLAGAPSGIPKTFGLNGLHDEPCKGTAKSTLAQVPGGEIIGAEASLDLNGEWEKVAVCGDAPLVATRLLDDGRIIAFADSGFLTNASLSRKEHVSLAFSLFLRPTVVSKVDRWIAAGAGDPYRAIANSGLSPVVIHGLLWLLLWALAAGIAFGARGEQGDAPRTAFSEHVRALGLLYARARGTRHALSSYSGWALDRLGARFRSGASTRMVDLASAVAAATGRSEAQVVQVLAEAYQARDDQDALLNDSNDLVTLAALDDLMHEAGGHK